MSIFSHTITLTFYYVSTWHPQNLLLSRIMNRNNIWIAFWNENIIGDIQLPFSSTLLIEKITSILENLSIFGWIVYQPLTTIILLTLLKPELTSRYIPSTVISIQNNGFSEIRSLEKTYYHKIASFLISPVYFVLNPIGFRSDYTEIPENMKLCRFGRFQKFKIWESRSYEGRSDWA